jgi:signal peptidase I
MAEADKMTGNSDRVEKNELWEWIKAILIALALVGLIRIFLFTPTIVSGESMEPNFFDKERLIVNKIIYDFRTPQRGEVIVFHSPYGRDYIKRVIALPGETVRVEDDDVFINGERLKEPYIEEIVKETQARGQKYNTHDYPEREVPEGTVFVLGDNRPISQDSRSIGFVEQEDIVGRADLVFWPLHELQIIKHGQ